MKWLKREWFEKNLKNIIIFLGPILFEISNQVTGNWTDESGKLSIGVGKFVTILIGASYFIALSYITYKEKGNEDKVTELKNQLNELKRKNNVYDNNTKSLCDILGYTTEKTRNQITDFKKKGEIDTSFVNATNAATIVCESIYKNIIGLLNKYQDITVNYYRKYCGDDGKAYTEMIAHEGYNTTPKFYMIPRLLKIDKKSYFCERLLENNNPDIVFLKTKGDVAKAFGIQEDKCKYNQYVGIPIRRFASNEKVALIEIVAHNSSIMWNDIEEVRKFAQCYCAVFEEYFLMIDMLANLYGTVNKVQRDNLPTNISGTVNLIQREQTGKEQYEQSVRI